MILANEKPTHYSIEIHEKIFEKYEDMPQDLK